MSLEDGVFPVPELPDCEITGCTGQGSWRMGKAGRTLTVCYRCRDEMMSLWGWRIV